MTPHPAPRRFDISPRAHDGLWLVWQRRTPPRGIAMEWVIVAIEPSRKAALRVMGKLVHQHTPQDTAGFHSPPLAHPAGQGRAETTPALPASFTGTLPESSNRVIGENTQ